MICYVAESAVRMILPLPNGTTIEVPGGVTRIWCGSEKAARAHAEGKPDWSWRAVPLEEVPEHRREVAKAAVLASGAAC